MKIKINITKKNIGLQTFLILFLVDLVFSINIIKNKKVYLKIIYKYYYCRFFD